MHAYHDGLVGFDPDQILHDGCDECETRGANISTAVGSLDMQNFERAWTRAAVWGKSGLRGMSAAEAPLLSALWAIQVQLERRGLAIGTVPGDFAPWEHELLSRARLAGEEA